MNIEMFLASEWCERVMLTLASFLWQGALLGVLAALAMFLLRRRSARLRYGVMVGALLLMAACPVLTYVAVSHVPEPVAWALPDTSSNTLNMPIESANTSEVKTAEAAPAPASPITPVDVPEMPSAAAPAQARGPEQPWATTEQMVFLAYAAGVAAMLLRLGMGVLGGKRLRRRSRPVEESILLTTLAHSAQVLGMRVAPALAYCQHVAVPTVVGIVRPMILLPVSFASGLTPQQIEFLLLHELAHIRRFDHLVNIAQRLIEAFLFFHPAVWYVSRRIRFERELCCDDLVVKQGGEARAYAESLIAAATLACQGKMAPASLAALSATDNPSQLRRRVQRLLGANESRVRLVHGGWTISALMLVVAAIAVAQVNAPATKEQTPQVEPATIAPDESAQVEPVQVPDVQPSKADAVPAQTPPPVSAGTPAGKSAEDVGKLLKQAKDKDWWLRKLAIKQMVEAGGGDFYQNAIIEALTDEDDRVKAAAATALGELRDPEAVNHLVAALKNKSPVKEAAAEALTKFPQDKVLPILRIAAADEDYSVYSGSIEALQRIDNPETIPLLVSLLPNMAPHGASTTNALRTAFGKKDAAQVLAALSEASRDASKDMRVGVAQLLRPASTERGVKEEQPAGDLCRSGEAVTILNVLATDSERDVRAAAVYALGDILSYRTQYSKQPVDPVIPGLVTALRDSNSWIAAAAAGSLMQVSWQPPTPEDRAYYYIAQGNTAEAAALGAVALKPLKDALSSETEPVLQDKRSPVQPSLRPPRIQRTVPGSSDWKAMAVEALGDVNDEGAVPVLLEWLRSSDINIAATAARALGKRKEPRAVEPIMELAKHPDAEYRYAAVSALEQIGDARAVPTLISALSDPDGSVRNRAADALGEFGDKHATAELVRVALNDTGQDTRYSALKSLGKLKDPAAVEPLAKAMKALSGSSHKDDGNLARRICIALGEVGGPEACDALLSLLPEWREVEALIAALGRTQDPRAVGPIASLLMEHVANEKWDGVEASLNALASTGLPQAMKGIGDFVIVMVRKVPGYAKKGLQLLETMPQPEAGNVIYDLISGELADTDLRLEGAFILARLGDERARSILDEAKDDPKVRSKVSEALKALDAAKGAKSGGATPEPVPDAAP